MKRLVAIKLSIVQKTVLTVVMVLWWLFGPMVGYQDVLESYAEHRPATDIASYIVPHMLYMISHANFWHLAGNLFVLWLIRGKLYLWRAMVLAFLFSFLPGVGSIWEIMNHQPVPLTVGFSGVLFAIGGIKWGFWCVGQHKGKISRKGNVLDEQRTEISPKRVKDFLIKVLPFAILGILIPHLNWTIHLYCLIGGFVAGMLRGYDMKYIK